MNGASRRATGDRSTTRPVLQIWSGGDYFGEHQPGGSGEHTGNFKDGVATTLVPAVSHSRIPNSTSFYIAPWFTDPALQFDPAKEYVLGWGFTSSAQQMAAGANEVFQFPGWSAATNPATTGGVAGAGSTYRGTPIDFQIEYSDRVQGDLTQESIPVAR